MSPVTAGQFVSVAEIDAGKLIFYPAPAADGTSRSFTFQVEDDGRFVIWRVDSGPESQDVDVQYAAGRPGRLLLDQREPDPRPVQVSAPGVVSVLQTIRTRMATLYGGPRARYRNPEH